MPGRRMQPLESSQEMLVDIMVPALGLNTTQLFMTELRSTKSRFNLPKLTNKSGKQGGKSLPRQPLYTSNAMVCQTGVLF